MPESENKKKQLRKSRKDDPKRGPPNRVLPHATAPVVLQRTEEIARIRLDGAAFWDVREYVREKESEAGSVWHIGRPEFSLSDAQLWRYIEKADAMCVEKNEKNRAKILETGVARRENLYAKAVLSGDIRTALAVLSDLEKLRGIYPSAEKQATAPAILSLDHLTIDQLKQLERLLTPPGGGTGTSQANPPV